MSRRSKGSGSIRDRNGGFEASYSFTDAAGKRRRRSQSFETRTEARRWLTAKIAEVESGRVADPGKLTVGEYLAEWVGSLGLRSLEPSTIDWYRSAVERHIVPTLGHHRLSRLTPAMIEAFLAEKAERGRLDGKGALSPTSVRRLRVTLHKALDAAVRKNLLNRNPIDLVESPKLPARDVTVNAWDDDELAQFIDAASGDRLGAIWRLAALTGLRREELCALKWSDIDLDAGRLSVRRAAVPVAIRDGGPIRIKSPKTPKSLRTVELDAETVAALRAWRRAQLEERLLAGTAWIDEDWIVADELGHILRPDRVSKMFNRVVGATDLRGITLGQLRHSHLTALLSGGENPKIAQERAGHSSIKVTLDTYAAVLPNMQREAIDRLAERYKAR